MQGIQELLKKFLDFTPPAKTQARAIVRAFKECVDTDLNEEAITIRNGKAYLSVDTILKSEIALHKKELLAKTSTLLGNSAVLDIV